MENKYQESDYTEEDWKVFADAVKEAKEVIGNKNATQKQVDDAKKKLEDAVNLLESKKPEEKPDDTASEEAVAALYFSCDIFQFCHGFLAGRIIWLLIRLFFRFLALQQIHRVFQFLLRSCKARLSV